jgi:enoyl-[acyl-carrier protein] reductase I
MGLLSGKRGIVMGIANEFSLAAGVAEFIYKEQGAQGFSHLPDAQGGPPRMARRVQKVADPLDVKFIRPCDVRSDEDIARFFSEVKEEFGTLDFLVHSIAFAPLEDIQCATIDASRDGFKTAMDISVYSFIAVAREAAKLMGEGGSIVTMTYFGGERVVEGYNLMGLCKAALESATKYLSFDLGSKGIRVNAVSAGPVKTLAASAVGEVDDMLALYDAVAPLQRNITQDEVGKATGFLLSDLSSGTTGETLHVDGGYHVMGSPGRAIAIGNRN